MCRCPSFYHITKGHCVRGLASTLSKTIYSAFEQLSQAWKTGVDKPPRRYYSLYDRCCVSKVIHEKRKKRLRDELAARIRFKSNVRKQQKLGLQRHQTIGTLAEWHWGGRLDDAVLITAFEVTHVKTAREE